MMKKRNNVTDNQNQTGVRTKKKRSFVDWLLLIAAVLLLLGAGVLFSLNSIKNKQREEKTNDILANIEQGQATIIVNADALPVEGEEIETFNIKPSGADGTDTSSESSAAPSETTIPYEAENVVLTAVGTLKIDAIDLEQPLLDDAGIIPLRYAPGIQEGTAMPGQEGNCVILGHRMTSWEFFDYLLHEAGVVGTPGSGFGPCGEGFFRLTAFGSKEASEEALRRIAILG